MTEGTGEDSPTPQEIAVADDSAVDNGVGKLSTSQVSVSPSQGDCFSGASGEASESLEPVVEVDQSELRQEAERDIRDEDGAVVFEDPVGEGRQVRLPPDVPIPSKEMVRGTCPVMGCEGKLQSEMCLRCMQTTLSSGTGREILRTRQQHWWRMTEEAADTPRTWFLGKVLEAASL